MTDDVDVTLLDWFRALTPFERLRAVSNWASGLHRLRRLMLEQRP